MYLSEENGAKSFKGFKPYALVCVLCICVTNELVYIYIYFFFLIKKEERERRLERGKNDHRNKAGNRTRDLSLSGRLLYQLSYWARPDSEQITEPPSPSPAERMKER